MQREKKNKFLKMNKKALQFHNFGKIFYRIQRNRISFKFHTWVQKKTNGCEAKAGELGNVTLVKFEDMN